MTPEEQAHQRIIDSIQSEWNNDYATRYKIYKSNKVMDVANNISREESPVADRVSKMDSVAQDHGFLGIKDVLTFRKEHEHLLQSS
ncbi:MAG: hypothetical protein J0M04_09650 [Verrucomicrobia bacterium]|nr:hypothetical protein [Verrucomicrobiota bacterium]